MKITAYFSIALMGLIGLSACDSKATYDYEPAEPVAAGHRVYFAKASESFEVKDGVNSVDVNVYRPESEIASEQRVQLETTDESGLFSVPAEVVIPAGQVSAPVEITFDGAALTEDQPYTLNIAISEINANEYAISATAVTITRSNWSAWEPFGGSGIGYYSFSLLFDGDEYPVQLISRTSLSDANNVQYQLQWLVDYDDPDSWSTFLTFSSADGGKTLDIPEQEFMEDDEYGMIYVASLYNYMGEDEYKGLSTYDEETGEFTFNLIYYCSLGIFGAGDETFQLLSGFDTESSLPKAHALRVPRKK